MDRLLPRTLKSQARAALSQAAYSPRKLFFLHGAIAVGADILIALLNLALNAAIAVPDGLAGMQTLAILTTTQSALQIISMVALPFWQMGILCSCLHLIRTEPARPQSFLEGFRRFGPVLRLLLLKGVILMGVCFVCSYAASALFTLTPLSRDFIEQMLPLVESADMAAMEAALSPDAIMQLLPSMTGFFVIFLVLVCALYIPLSYRLYMTDFCIMDQQGVGAVTAVRASFHMTKGRCLALFRLNVSFWWYYGLNIACTTLLYLDQLLPALGVGLPVQADVFFWICYGLYSLSQVALLTLFAPQVQTTYAAAYDTLVNTH